MKPVSAVTQRYVSQLLKNPSNFQFQFGSFFRCEGNVHVRKRAFETINFPCKVFPIRKEIADLANCAMRSLRKAGLSDAFAKCPFIFDVACISYCKSTSSANTAPFSNFPKLEKHFDPRVIVIVLGESRDIIFSLRKHANPKIHPTTTTTLQHNDIFFIEQTMEDLGVHYCRKSIVPQGCLTITLRAFDNDIHRM